MTKQPEAHFVARWILFCFVSTLTHRQHLAPESSPKFAKNAYECRIVAQLGIQADVYRQKTRPPGLLLSGFTVVH